MCTKPTHKFLEPVDWVNQQPDRPFRRVLRLDRPALVDRQSRNRRRCTTTTTCSRSTGWTAGSSPISGRPHRSSGPCSTRPPKSSACRKESPFRREPETFIRLRSAPAPSTDFDPHLYIGTSSWISCHVPYKKTAPTTNVASIPSAIPGRYVIADEHETAGACLTFLKDIVYADDVLGTIAQPANYLALSTRPPKRRRPGQTGRCSHLGSTVSGPRSTTTRSGAGSTTCLFRTRGATWCGRCSRGSLTTRDGSSMRSRSSATRNSNRLRS